MTISPPISLVLARFDDVVSRGLQSLIASDSELQLLAADVPQEAMGTMLAEHTPDMAILDLGALVSPAQIRALRLRFPRVRIILLADNHPSSEEVRLLIGFGATACISKQLPETELLQAIHLAARGLHLLPTEPRRPQ